MPPEDLRENAVGARDEICNTSTPGLGLIAENIGRRAVLVTEATKHVDTVDVNAGCEINRALDRIHLPSSQLAPKSCTASVPHQIW